MENWINNAKNKKCVVSFSGGKDSTLALYRGMEQGEVVAIIVMMERKGERSRAHSINRELIKKQAKLMGVRLILGNASWSDYEKIFIEKLEEAKSLGAEVLITGDIDMPEHGCWYSDIAKKVGVDLAMPLWNKGHKEVVEEFIDLGFKTKLITINTSMGMIKEDLGRILNRDYIEELEKRAIDVCAENGEFHTICVDGPIFEKPLGLKGGNITSKGEYMFLNL